MMLDANYVMPFLVGEAEKEGRGTCRRGESTQNRNRNSKAESSCPCVPTNRFSTKGRSGEAQRRPCHKVRTNYGPASRTGST
jgi:hypothetical protein